MPDYLATLLGALIGALIGSIGAVFVQFWLSGQANDKNERKLIAQKYLYQLQDAAESLWYRIENLAVFYGEIKDDSYFEYTTLYALGRVLACEKIFGLDGIYPLLNDSYPGLSDVLRNRIDKTLGRVGLKQYDRIALAETLVVTDEHKIRLATYLEFRRKYEKGETQEKEWLEPARLAIRFLSNESIRQDVSELMYEVAMEISKSIKVRSSLPKLHE
jgi:hypothetical protein